MKNNMAKEGDMKGTSNKRLIPELRFPKFEKDGEWDEKKLGECLLQSPDYGLNAPAVPFSPKLPTYLRITDISDDGKFIKEGKVSVNAVLTEANSLQDGDIVFARTGASVGKTYKYRKGDGQLVFAGFLIRIKPNTLKYNSEFIFQYLLTDTYKKWVSIISVRSGQPGINSNEYSSLSIPFPSPAEQQKIAECLSSIDEEISAMKEKAEQLKINKKGLMQKLFPVAGKFVPELRFPEFKKDEEWEGMTLGEVFERVSEKNVNNNQNVLTISAQYGLVSQYDYFNKNVAAANIKSYYFIHKGDFAYNKSRSQGYPFGVIKPLRRYDSGVVSTLYICFRAKTNCYIDFYEQYFDTDLINNEISKIAQEGARNHGLLNISIDDFFNKIKILVPHSSEQEKIAECLSSIDELISLYENKVTLLEQHKKGLMQQLFPRMTKS